MKLRTRDLKALDLIQDSKRPGRLVSTSQRHARLAVHPSTAGRLVRLGLARFEVQHSLAWWEPRRTYVLLTAKGREALRHLI